MSAIQESDRALAGAPAIPAAPRAAAEPAYQVIRRNGAVTAFDESKISVALTKAFLAVEGAGAAASRRVHDIVEGLTAQIVGALARRADHGRTFHIEEVQDQVELALMRGEHHKVARAYVLYRDERSRERAAAAAKVEFLAGGAGAACHRGRRQPRAAGPGAAGPAGRGGLRRPGRRRRRAGAGRDPAQSL